MSVIDNYEICPIAFKRWTVRASRFWHAQRAGKINDRWWRQSVREGG